MEEGWCTPSSLRRARVAAVVVLLLSIVYNVPQFAEREAYEQRVGCGVGDVRTRWRTKKTDVFGPTYYIVYKTICYVVFRSVGPLLVLLVLNARLVLALNRLARRRRRLNRSTAAAAAAAAAGGDRSPVPRPSTAVSVLAVATMTSDCGNHRRSPATARQHKCQRENITLMLVVVVFVFIVCQLPDLVLRISAALVRWLLSLHGAFVLRTSPYNIGYNSLIYAQRYDIICWTLPVGHTPLISHRVTCTVCNNRPNALSCKFNCKFVLTVGDYSGITVLQIAGPLKVWH